MKGVIIRKAKIISEDERRKIISVLNGELGVRDIHILEMKKEDILGNHWHLYPEIMYVMKGKCHYWLKHILTGEEEELDIEEGDIMIKTGFIVHTCRASEDCILIDGSTETWIDEDFNHIKEVLIKSEGLKMEEQEEIPQEVPEEIPEEPVEDVPEEKDEPEQEAEEEEPEETPVEPEEEIKDE